jgi:hypothetical protein
MERVGQIWRVKPVKTEGYARPTQPRGPELEQLLGDAESCSTRSISGRRSVQPYGGRELRRARREVQRRSDRAALGRRVLERDRVPECRPVDGPSRAPARGLDAVTFTGLDHVGFSLSDLDRSIEGRSPSSDVLPSFLPVRPSASGRGWLGYAGAGVHGTFPSSFTPGSVGAGGRRLSELLIRWPPAARRARARRPGTVARHASHRRTLPVMTRQ